MAKRSVGVLPGTLREAIQETEKDGVVLDALGPHIAERFLQAKRQVWDDYPSK